MKKSFNKILLCSILTLMFYSSKSTAQYMVNGKEVDTTFNTNMNHVFGNLDVSRIPLGLLKDYAMEFTNLNNYDGTVLVDSNKIDKAVFSLLTILNLSFNLVIGNT